MFSSTMFLFCQKSMIIMINAKFQQYYSSEKNIGNRVAGHNRCAIAHHEKLSRSFPKAVLVGTSDDDCL